MIPRYTSNPEEIEHLVKMQERPFGGVIEVALKNGAKYYGIELGSRGGNNGREALVSGKWKYYGTATLLTVNEEKVELDLLDVASITEAPQYKDAMIEILKKMGMLAGSH